MGWQTINKRPLTEKQWAILTFLETAIPERGPQSCEDITKATGYIHCVSTTLQSLRFRGLVEIGKQQNRMVAVWVKPSGEKTST